MSANWLGRWLLSCFVGLIGPVLWAQNGSLELADQIRLVSCNPAITRPCFRMKFNVLDPQGRPLNLNLPPDKDISNEMQVSVEGVPKQPFYAVAQSTGSTVARGRVTLILVDISGSMNIHLASGNTRFQTAQQALRQYLQDFDPAVDQLAIVPFESHNVAAQINEAQFARTKDDANAQIQALPIPQNRNNTGLYSAVVLGLQVLSRHLSGMSGSPPETLLVVMTDGKNEVYKGDDPGLLAGPTGLQQASEAVRASGTQVIAVGFGNPGDIDETALRQLSTKYYAAQDLSQLQQAFSFARSMLINRVVATFESGSPDRSSLAGQTVRIDATLKVPGVGQFTSGEKIWSAPKMGSPNFEGQCDKAEIDAAMHTQSSTETSWLSIVRPALVFLGLGTALLVLWFWVPRLVWPEQYIGSFVTQRGSSARWSDKSEYRPRNEVRPSRPAPPGFETNRPGAQAPRSPGDRTYVQPDFSKSRLQKAPREDH